MICRAYAYPAFISCICTFGLKAQTIHRIGYTDEWSRGKSLDRDIVVATCIDLQVAIHFSAEHRRSAVIKEVGKHRVSLRYARDRFQCWI